MSIPGPTHTDVAGRRALLQAGAACVLARCAFSARAGEGSWQIYPAAQTKVLLPAKPTAPAAPTVVPIPQPTSHVKRSVPSATGQQAARPPAAFEEAAARYDVPAWLMYSVALQESQVTFGRTAVPYPWTLCVSGHGERHRDIHAARTALRRYLDAGITNVDCGAMQVNWRWHSDKLLSVDRALDPYANLDVGARLLADLRRSTGDWRMAVQLYHAGSLDTDERRARAHRYVASVERKLARHGHSLLAQGTTRLTTRGGSNA